MLCLGKERKMLASKEIVSHEKRHQEFRDTYTNPSIQQLTTTFRTWTDSHIFNVFRNAPITLRILIMCESYPFFLCLCLYSTYVLTLYSLYSGLILVLTCFLFYPHCYSRCGRLSSYGTRTKRPNSGGKPKNRSWGGVGWGHLETTVFGIEGK